MKQVLLNTTWITLIISILLEFWVIKWSYKHDLYDKPNDRKIHTEKIPRLGGIAFFPILCLALMALVLKSWPAGRIIDLLRDSTTEIIALMAASCVIFVYGLFDDFVSVRYRNKFFGQAVAALILSYNGICVSNLHGLLGLGELPIWASWPLAVFAVIFIINAINFIDGIDGLASTLCGMALLYYMLAFIIGHQFMHAVLALIVLLSLLPFLYFNLLGNVRKRTKVFMGDAGSMFLGLMLAYLGFKLNSMELRGGLEHYNQFALAFAPVAFPCFDVLRVVFSRVQSGHNPFAADKNHIHHRIMAAGVGQHGTLVLVNAMSLVLATFIVLASSCLNLTTLLILSILVWMAIYYVVLKLIHKKTS
ncbi:MAG: undecaprenyl/decaprenyl-phosphate alpha-N-acetylglucosaminyl 1-phosphate transferase [Muribaculaceae bacterium]|nr:undecaprenyl/decaprenyl-phosphate alpha-N-acetylglucosaminyl 1-phosphate transferase [Muribaculaceae bacterium]